MASALAWSDVPVFMRFFSKGTSSVWLEARIKRAMPPKAFSRPCACVAATKSSLAKSVIPWAQVALEGCFEENLAGFRLPPALGRLSAYRDKHQMPDKIDEKRSS